MDSKPIINAFQGAAIQQLPRLLAMIDTNLASSTYGMMDRRHWGWKLTDYANAVPQGVAHGLAELLDADLLPDWLSEGAVMRRLEQLLAGVRTLTRHDGSVDNAYPFEKSFAATGFVLHDFAMAWDLLDSRLNASQRHALRETLSPLADFLHRADETHGFIANHLAGAAAGLGTWSRLSGEAGVTRSNALLERILARQSREGWYLEYCGPDPGYQTLCLTFLAHLYRAQPNADLLASVDRSLTFLAHFAHPDGSFGGAYGARNTRFVYPSGIVCFAQHLPLARSLSQFIERSVARMDTVPLASIDTGNLANAFNSYCQAAACHLTDDNAAPTVGLPSLPSAGPPGRTIFDEAGLICERGVRHYTIVNWKKGGVTYHFREGELAFVDSGVLLQDKAGRLASTQSWRDDNGVELRADRIEITAPLIQTTCHAPTPFQFIVLRLLCVTLLRFGPINAAFKRILVRYLNDRQKNIGIDNVRTIEFGADLIIDDHMQFKRGWCRSNTAGTPFHAIHMASQGYWQKNDDASPNVDQDKTRRKKRNEQNHPGTIEEKKPFIDL